MDLLGFCLALIGFILDALGIWLRGGILKIAWEFASQFVLPGIGYLVDGNIWGFFYSIASGFMWNLLLTFVYQLPWWNAILFTGEIGSGSIIWQLLIAVAAFFWDVYWQIIAPPNPPPLAWSCPAPFSDTTDYSYTDTPSW